MKTPISYYGGKQKMLRHILPLIPEHTLYTEAFCGGAAVLFAKPPADCEVINDPPCIGSNCGHYEGLFNDQSMAQLLALLERLQGKFMLTMFPYEPIEQAARRNGWTIHRVERTITAADRRSGWCVTMPRPLVGGGSYFDRKTLFEYSSNSVLFPIFARLYAVRKKYFCRIWFFNASHFVCAIIEIKLKKPPPDQTRGGPTNKPDLNLTL